MVGFSELAHRDEAHALAAVRAHERLVRAHVSRLGGRVVKSLGDGILAEFPSALDAVGAAVDIQREKTRGRSGGRSEFPPLRIGVHLGDAVRRGPDLLGDAVNIVARIEPQAEPGGVCVSQQVYDQVRNKVDLEFRPIGAPSLKNIASPIPLYQISFEAQGAAPPPPRTELPRVAVLPLANLSGRVEDEYFADGITEELIQMLSRIAGLRVIGRSSVMRFKHTDRGPTDVAKELGASAVVEGSIRKMGRRVRCTARLLDPKNAETLWSAEYDRENRDLFSLQSDISEKVAKALEVEILRREKTALRQTVTSDSEAHTLLLRGRHLLNQRTQGSIQESSTCFRKALERDPLMASAWAGLADGYSTLAWLEFVRPREAFPKARTAALRAIALDPRLAEAHASLGFVRLLYDREWNDAERELRRAIELNPSYPTAHQFYSDLLKARGRFAEAETEVRRALELDPLSLGIHTALGHVLYLARRYDDAIRQYRRALELDPTFALAHLWFGRPYLEKGEFARAIEEVRVAVKLSKESTMSLAVLGHAYASSGRRSEALRILQRLRTRARSRYVPSYWIGLVHVGLDDFDQAFAWLNRAARERSAWLAWIKVEPRFDRLRSDPRYLPLLQRLRLA